MNLLLAEQIWRALVEFCQSVDKTDVTVNRALSLAVEGEMLDEFLA